MTYLRIVHCVARKLRIVTCLFVVTIGESSVARAVCVCFSGLDEKKEDKRLGELLNAPLKYNCQCRTSCPKSEMNKIHG